MWKQTDVEKSEIVDLYTETQWNGIAPILGLFIHFISAITAQAVIHSGMNIFIAALVFFLRCSKVHRRRSCVILWFLSNNSNIIDLQYDGEFQEYLHKKHIRTDQ